MIESAITQITMIDQLFLSPLGLLGLLALIPLAIFYLVKPKPEEQVMPSMRFFQQQEGNNKLRQSLRKILRNLILLLHILTVIVFALALAQPFINTFQQPENSVVILDTSASMQNNMRQAENFIEQHLGEENTLIVANSDTKVKVEEASPSRVRRALEGVKAVETRTDMVSALETARNYEGRLVVASDLDQTVDDREIAEVLGTQAGRLISIMQVQEENKWGITDLRIQENKTEATIQNFAETRETITVTKNGNTRKTTLDSQESVVADFDNNLGKNTIKLSEDGMAADNTASYVLPDTEKITVAYEGPRNSYLDTVIQVIENTELMTGPDALENSDVVLLTDKITDDQRISQLEEKIQGGGSAVVFKDSRALSRIFGMNTTLSEINTSVEITFPERIDVGDTEVLRRGIQGGESISDPAESLKLHGYGEGQILAYNIEGAEFRKNFLYPVFWKSVFSRLSEKPSVRELNMITGESLEGDVFEVPYGSRLEGRIEVNQTGFYESGSTVYAANLLSQDESSPDGEEYSPTGSRSLEKTREPIQELVMAVLGILIGLELIYLWYRGDL